MKPIRALYHSGSAPAKAAPPSDDRRTVLVPMPDAQNPNLSRRSILAGVATVPLAGVFPPAATAADPLRGWLDECADTLVKTGGMDRACAEQSARSCLTNCWYAEGIAPNGLPNDSTGRDAAFIEMDHWDAS